MNLGKNFKEWFCLKEKLDGKTPKPPFVNEGDLWWASLGENVGSEIDGKSHQFSRPVVLIKKLTHGFYLVAPTTTSDKKGSWYVDIILHEKHSRVCLHQIRTIDYRRLWSKLGELDEGGITRIRQGFDSLYK